MIHTTIEIDCEPFVPRPDVYFKHIWISILGREESSMPNAISKFFGCWTWEVEISEEQQSRIADYIKHIYNQGKIRYGSW